ncbi:MAG: lipopolysaccharide biosynthesis protein [Flavobacteriales bacterium]
MKFIKDTFIYFGTTVLNQLIPFILIPIITRQFTTDDVGVLSMFTIFNLIFSTISSLSLNSYLQYIYYRKPEEVPVAIFNIFLVSAVTNTLLGFLNGYAFQELNALQDIPNFYIWWIPVSSFFSLSYFIYLTLLRNRKKSLEFGVLSTLMTISNLVLSLYLIYYTDLSWESRSIPALVLPVFFGCYTFYKLAQSGDLIFKPDLNLIKKAFLYSLPLLVVVLLEQALNLSDRYIIDYYLGKSDVGIYDMGYKIGALVFVAINAFNLVFVPKVYEYFSQLEKKESEQDSKHETDLLKHDIVSFFHLYLLIIIIITIGVLLLGKLLFLIEFFDPKFEDSFIVVTPVAFGYLFYGLYTISSVIIGQTFKTYYNVIVVSIGIAINLGLNILYIPKYGNIVAAWSTLLTCVVMYIITFSMAYKIIPLPWFKFSTIHHSVKVFKKIISRPLKTPNI